MAEELEAAARLADDVAVEIRDAQSIGPAFGAAERAAAQLADEGVDLRTLLPATDEVGQGFLFDKIPSGGAIVRAFLDALSTDLCSPEAELHKRIVRGIDISSAALIGWMLATLGLGVVAAPLIAPIAGAILALGLRAVCAAAADQPK